MGGSVVVAHLLGIQHPFWVPLTAAAVLQGETVRGFTQRAVQRVAGTAAGLALAWLLLSGLHPSPTAILLLVLVLQAAMLASLARNYAAAVALITAFALLILQLGNPGPAPIGARRTDTLVGVGSALAAAHLLWPRTASRRLPGALRALLDAAAADLRALAPAATGPELRERETALQSALWRVKDVATDAGAEVPASRTAANLRPRIAAAERLGYLLLAAPHAGVPVPPGAAARGHGARIAGRPVRRPRGRGARRAVGAPGPGGRRRDRRGRGPGRAVTEARPKR